MQKCLRSNKCLGPKSRARARGGGSKSTKYGLNQRKSITRGNFVWLELCGLCLYQECNNPCQKKQDEQKPNKKKTSERGKEKTRCNNVQQTFHIQGLSRLLGETLWEEHRGERCFSKRRPLDALFRQRPPCHVGGRVAQEGPTIRVPPLQEGVVGRLVVPGRLWGTAAVRRPGGTPSHALSPKLSHGHPSGSFSRSPSVPRTYWVLPSGVGMPTPHPLVVQKKWDIPHCGMFQFLDFQIFGIPKFQILATIDRRPLRMNQVEH